MTRALRADRRGAALVEFALILPLLLVALFGLLEGARLVWTVQALDQAAYSTARCRLIAGADCADAGKQIAYAVRRARANGISIDPSNVAIDPAATCRGASGALLVTITGPFSSAAGKLLPFPKNVRGASCLPALPPGG